LSNNTGDGRPLTDDPLTEIARDGARRMLAMALRAEADAFVARRAVPESG
jgi:hypothetical protein